MRFHLLRQTCRTCPRWTALLLALPFVAACSNSSEVPTATVSGKVTLGGAPVPAGTVLFMTDDGQAATAELNPDGTYHVHCRPGRYKVSLTPPPPPDPLAAPGGSVRSLPVTVSQSIPQRYRDLGRSGLSVEVKAGDNTYDIPLTK
jgi:hypothetical protein